MKEQRNNIICFGEILWDILPTDKVAGGAPMNVAYHANQFGIATQMISKIGNDYLGQQLLELLKEKGVDTSLVQQDDNYPTSTVQVTLDAMGSPTYEIIAPVAWDYIHLNAENKTAVKSAVAFVFGSLSARNDVSQKTLFELLKLSKLKVFDVNLRSPYYKSTLLIQLLHQADIIKMNDEELEIISKWLDISDNEKSKALKIKNYFNCEQLIITRGAKGAWLLKNNELISCDGLSIEVKDTIGSGDSFLAAYLSKYLEGEKPEKCLQFATATGAYVATKKGGTPTFSEENIWELLKK